MEEPSSSPTKEEEDVRTSSTYYKVAFSFSKLKATHLINAASFADLLENSLNIHVHSIKINFQTKFIAAYVDDRESWERILKEVDIDGAPALTILHSLFTTNDPSIEKLFMRNAPSNFNPFKGKKLLKKNGFKPIAVVVHRQNLAKQSLNGSCVWIEKEEASKLLNTTIKLHDTEISFVKANQPDKKKQKEGVLTVHPNNSTQISEKATQFLLGILKEESENSTSQHT